MARTRNHCLVLDGVAHDTGSRDRGRSFMAICEVIEAIKNELDVDLAVTSWPGALLQEGPITCFQCLTPRILDFQMRRALDEMFERMNDA